MNTRQSSMVEQSVKIYQVLLYLYPKAHRDEYAWLMVQYFRDKAYDAYLQDGDAGIILHWLASLLDLLISVVNEHREKGFSMSFQFLGKIRTPLLMLAGVLLSLSAYGQLRPVAWYISSPLHDAADALLIPAFFVFATALLGLLIANRQVMNKVARVALIGVVLASLSLSVVAILEATNTLSNWGDNAWTFFVTMMFTIMICLIIFSASMIRKGYPVMTWFLVHPVLMLIVFVVNIVQEMARQVEYVDGEPAWGMFFMITTWGITWIIAGYLLRTELTKKKTSTGLNFPGDQMIPEVSG